MNSFRTVFEFFVRQTARDLAQRGAYLILGCRSRLKGLKAVKEIAMSTGNSRVEMMDLDLTSLASVREFAKAVLARAEPLQVAVVDCFFTPSSSGADQQRRNDERGEVGKLTRLAVHCRWS